MKKVKHQVLDKTSTLIISAFGFVAALSWNEAIKALFNKFYGRPDELVPMLVYALVVTILAVLVTLLVTRVLKK